MHFHTQQLLCGGGNEAQLEYMGPFKHNVGQSSS